jgi:hypothetical protein
MNDDITIEEEVARLVASDTDGLARRVSEMRGRPYGVANLTPDQEMWAWTFTDMTVDEHQLRAAGMPESEVNVHKFPLRSKLMDQAGRTFEDQARYHNRMEERRLRAEAKGHLPKPPERTGGIMNEKFVPIKEV